MSTTHDWEPPSPHLAELLKRMVLALLDEADGLLAAMDAAAFEVNRELLELAPELTDPLRAAAMSNVMVWATANLRKPGLPVPANLSPENVEFARDVVRHGFDETILSGFRVGQNVGTQAMTDVAFRIAEDHEDLHALLRLTSSSIFSYVEATLEGLGDVIRTERAQLRSATSTARAEAVALILEGAPIPERRATQSLGYEVHGGHRAAVVWSDEAASEGVLEEAARSLARSSGSERSLMLPVGSTTVWLWLGRSKPGRADPSSWGDEGMPRGVRIALGRPGRGIAGFRRSHEEAITTQRLVRRLPELGPVTAYEEVEVLSLVTADDDRGREFVTRTLGQLVHGPVELRDTLRAYLRHECSLTRTAEAQFAHRNTVAARLERARELLPTDLAGRTLQVALALEMARVL